MKWKVTTVDSAGTYRRELVEAISMVEAKEKAVNLLSLRGYEVLAISARLA